MMFSFVLAWGGLTFQSRAQSPNANEAGFEQEPEAAQSSGGESWYGYAAFGFVAGISLFIICKSARRS
jgi:hypothetical protein